MLVFFLLRISSSRSSFTEDESEHDENSYLVKKTPSARKKSYRKWAKDEVWKLIKY